MSSDRYRLLIWQNRGGCWYCDLRTRPTTWQGAVALWRGMAENLRDDPTRVAAIERCES